MRFDHDILVVDDEPVVLSGTRRVLESEGFSVDDILVELLTTVKAPARPIPYRPAGAPGGTGVAGSGMPSLPPSPPTDGAARADGDPGSWSPVDGPTIVLAGDPAPVPAPVHPTRSDAPTPERTR